jgi:hypothetical protein
MKKTLLVTAAALSLWGAAAYAQTQGAPADQDQNRHMQAVPQKGPAATPPGLRGQSMQNAQPQQNARPMPMGGMREEQGQNVRQEHPGQGGAARITPTKVLNGSEKERLQQTVIESGSAPRIENLNFSVRVGAPIPRSIRLVPVPQEIIAIDPQWNGFLYFVAGDEIIVVDPNSYQVVGVLEA